MSEFGMQTVEEDSAARLPRQRQVQTEMMVSRETEEVQGQIVMAKRFPRNQVESYNRVLEACKRQKLAESAIYEYPRGATKVTGPSIRLAEEIARDWGNIQYGFTELEERNGESQVLAYAWDLETNVRQSRIFTVKHIRHTTKGDFPLTDPRDIYELIANDSARRVRACILSIVPGDVVDAAIDQCNKTLAGNADKPIVDLVRETADIFKTQFGVTLPQLEKYIGWKSESFTMKDLIRLKRVYNSLKDGMAKKEDIFDMSVTEEVINAFDTQDSKKGQKPAKEQKNKSAQKEQPDPEDDFMASVNMDELPWN